MKSKDSGMYTPSGELQGDDSAMPDRGTSTGMNSGTMLDGRSLDQSATNSLGSITGSTKSDPMMEGEVDDPTFGPAKGDRAEDMAEGE
jgi:hypothetical protein